MLEIPTTLDVAATYAGGSVIVVYAIRHFWRRISKDATEVTKDRAEINIIETMLSQLATLSQENLRLRTNESELANRLGKLEAKEKEAEDHIRSIERLQKKLDDKDIKIEEMIRLHSEENTRLQVILQVKDNEIKELLSRVAELEGKLSGKYLSVCPNCNKSISI